MRNSLLTEWDEGGEPGNFWLIYPVFKKPESFRKIYDVDKSRGKIKSSTLMWAIVLLIDRSNLNPYRNLRKEEKREDVAKEILKREDFNWDKFSEAISYMDKIYMDETERAYYSLKEKFDMRMHIISTTPVTLANFKKLDEMVSNNKIHRKEIAELELQLQQREEDGKTKGDIIESATEKGLL